MAAKKILILNGPNLNLLGKREPGIYGCTTLEDIIAKLQKTADDLGVEIEAYQTNHEGAMLDRIHAAMGNTDYIVINPGAFTHQSVALRDALLGVSIPFFEVHISNVHAREEFRHHSYLSDKATGVICGFGTDGYEFALRRAVTILNS